MRVPLSWLKEYVNLDDISPEAVAERLTTAGLEVGSIHYIGVPGPPDASHLVWDAETIVVAEILAVAAHPNADRLRLVTVDYGAPEPKTVVTGAANVAAGQRVVYATTGATVINGYSEEREWLRLEPKTLRGVRSEGMVISERELGLSDEHDGILILPDDAPVGLPLQGYLGDVVLDIELTANLGRAASIIGVAREVAALFDRPLCTPALEEPPSEAAASAPAVAIQIEVPALNPRFTALLVQGVRVGPSPAWMQRRLRLVGMRPINNVVDVTNYVMMEWGQPLHAFDYDKLRARAARSGAALPTLIIRQAAPGERLTTLDSRERTLDPGDILVTDSAGILAIAGIMGGAETEVSEATTAVLLEAATWDFIATRRAANRHTLFSEAAYRFSRGVHPAMARRGNLRAGALMAALAGGEVAAPLVDSYPLPASTPIVPIDAATVNRQLGTDLSTQQVAAYLTRLEFEVQREGEGLLATVPDHRLDVAIPADLVEEVARLHGLDRLPATLLADALPPLRPNRALALEERVRDLLVAAGLSEIISYTMSSPEADAKLQPGGGSGDSSDEGFVAIANPNSAERRVMRRTLLVSLLESLTANLRHRERLALFEVGLSFAPRAGASLPDEQPQLAIAMTGRCAPQGWQGAGSAERDFYAIKGVIEALLGHLGLGERIGFAASDHPTFQPGRAATVLLDGAPVGTLGELHPLVRRAHELPEQRIALAELALAPLLAAVPDSFIVVPVPRFPPVVQDLAVLVDQHLPAGEVERVIREASGSEVGAVTLFDLYQGEPLPAGKKSLAYSLRYQVPERTLTDSEVAGYHRAIADALRRELGAQIRGEDI